MDVSICIPIYNHQDIIEETNTKLHQIMNDSGHSYEIIYVDDGSSDNSSVILSSIQKQNDQVRLFLNDSNRGLGFTLRRLFLEAKGATLIYCDCDLPFQAQVLLECIEQVKFHDVVIASRYQGVKTQRKFFRHMASRLYARLCRFVLGLSVQDVGSGTVACRRKVIEELELMSNGFEIHAELYYKAMNKGFSIKEIPAHNFDSDKGSFHLFRHGLLTAYKTILLKDQ